MTPDENAEIISRKESYPERKEFNVNSSFDASNNKYYNKKLRVSNLNLIDLKIAEESPLLNIDGA